MVHFQEGNRLLSAGDMDRAVDQLSRAADLAPENPEILTGLARALVSRRKMRAAFEVYNKRIALGNVSAEDWCEMGHALMKVGEFAQAVSVYEMSIQSREDYSEAHHHLGEACFKLGDIDRAMTHLERSAKSSDNLNSWLALATLIPGSPEANHEKIRSARETLAERFSNAFPPARTATPRRRAARRGKIRVGYVSAFFYRANYMKPVWALINRHYRKRFEIHLFSDASESAGMAGYERHADDRVHLTKGLGNDALGDLIADCGIDILVDLNGYSAPARIALFLEPPAPVCVAWFNMYATSGLPGIHYLVGDEHVVSEVELRHYSETVIRLPVSYLTFTVTHRAPPVAAPPCLKEGTVTFGSLAAQYKINGRVVSAWANILNGADNTRLLIANRAMDAGQNREWLRNRFADAGVDPDRLTLLGSAKHYEYLQYYDRIDIALDAFPYNGGTTTMEAIWQGVPVLTFNGDRWASRTSRTLLFRTHLKDFVARDAEDMVAKAIRMAADPALPEKLVALRRTMRLELQQSPVCDGDALARSMERFYASVHNR